ncbi:MAG: hypothetical protein CVV27_05045 [Candidatus Melainabacteria bacterium HGW-Melainabacteria-1]|nr:MAG: hypothetical protein CVV27_05045 [Candidatus Melainabacteria bacterium HGW-Melainabacteria-1]
MSDMQIQPQTAASVLPAKTHLPLSANKITSGEPLDADNSQSPPIHTADVFGAQLKPFGNAKATFSLDQSSDPLNGAQSLSAPVQTASKEQIRQAVSEAVAASYERVPHRAGESRHTLNRRLQSSAPETHLNAKTPGIKYDGSAIVVIAFEGTGAFEARQAPVMLDAAKRLQKQGLSLSGAEQSMDYMVRTELNAKMGKEGNWSGLSAGALESLLKEPDLQANTQWLSFPSEEFEAFSHPSALQNISLKQVLNDALSSTVGETQGINHALVAMREIQAQARAQGKDPEFVILSHSSGGRSAVKFLEKAKDIKDEAGQPIRFGLALTIDPVREAHEALAEAFKELVNKGAEHNANRLRGWLDALPLLEVEQKKVYPPQVRHRAQPESLYAPSNVAKFYSFYQQKDTQGLKMEPSFGIHGSPVKGAINREIRNVGTSGHGEITYHPLVTKTFVEQLKLLLSKP